MPDGRVEDGCDAAQRQEEEAVAAAKDEVDVPVTSLKPEAYNGRTGWYTPRRMLLAMMAVNLLTYVDRGVVSSNGVNGQYRNTTCSDSCDDDESKACRDACGYTGLQGEFGLSNAADGLLASSFLAGYMVAAPFFAHAARTRNAFRVIAAGQACFLASLAGCGVAPSFPVLLAARCLTGAGEASFCAVAPALVEDAAPPGRSPPWLAAFFLCIPVGEAIGFAYGGLFDDTGWRWAFRIEACVCAPCLAFFLCADPPFPPSGATAAAAVSIAADLRCLLSRWRFAVLLAGWTLYTGHLGMLAFWAPKAVKAIFHMDAAGGADFKVGAITVAAGVAGTYAGGALLMRSGGQLRPAALISAASIGAGGAVYAACVWVPSQPLFFAAAAPAMVLLFIPQCTANYAALRAAPPHLRVLAMAVTNSGQHLLGDVPSPYYAGALQDSLGDWRRTFTVLTVPLCAGAAVLFAAAGAGGGGGSGEDGDGVGAKGEASGLLSDDDDARGSAPSVV